MTDRLTDITA